MRIGFALPNIGPVATPEAVIAVAERAEQLGYDSLWTIERLLYPVKLQRPYPVTADGSLPEVYKHALDPLEALTFAAARTTKIALGTSVLDIPYYNPVMLARRLTTLDFLSKGRVRVGLGLGWNKDRWMPQVGTSASAARWQMNSCRSSKPFGLPTPLNFTGKFYQAPESYIGPKPVQKPPPPIYMGAFVPRALKRLATYADGWNPVGMPLDGMAQMFDSIKQLAKEAGRDPSRIELVIRAHPEIADKPLGKERSLFSGSVDQIKEDIAGCRNIGAHEIHFDPTFMKGGQALDRWLAVMEQMRKLV